MEVAHVARWLLMIPRIVWRANGVANRVNTFLCLARSAARHMGLRLGPKEYRLVLDGNAYRVDANRRDLTPYASIWLEKEYEPDDRFVPAEGGVVIDIGAQVGFLTIRVAHRIGDGRVLAIEPDPASFERLRANIAANDLKNVTLHQCALSDEEGTLSFVRAAHSVDSRLASAARASQRLASEPGARTTSVRCTTLDRLAERERINRVDLLKLDVEGAELRILRAAEKTLPRVQALLIDIHGSGSIGPIEEILRRAGLKPVHRRGHVHAYARL